MKAFSVRPPWAWAIAHARKRVENRKRRTAYRGPVAIHASKKLTQSDVRKLERILGRRIKRERFVRGAIIATAVLIDVLPSEKCRNRWASRRYRYCWVLRNIRPLAEPIYVKGALGLWDLSRSCTRSQIKELRFHTKG